MNQPPDDQPRQEGGQPPPPGSQPPAPAGSPAGGLGPQSPPAPGGYAAAAGGQPNAPGAVPALILGILGLVICGLCAPFAWWQGRSAEAAIATSGGQYGGKGMATTGKILGIIGTVIMILLIIALIGFLVVGAGSSSSS